MSGIAQKYMPNMENEGRPYYEKFAVEDSDQNTTNKSSAPYYEQFAVKEEEPEWKKRRIPAPNEKIPEPTPTNGRNLLADVITSGTAYLGGPGDLASLAVGENPLTSKSLREGAFKLIPSLAPQNEDEKDYDENLSLLMGLVTPGNLIKSSLKGAGKVVGKLGGNKLSKMLKSNYSEVYEAGKRLGIPESALSPFKHGNVTEAVLKNAAKLGDEAKKATQFANNIASPRYQKIYEAGSKIPVNRVALRHVESGLQGIVEDIQKSPALVSESKDLLKFLNESIQGLKETPNLNLENLMALQKEAAKNVNWKSARQAGKQSHIQEARSVIEQAIYGVNPKIGKELTDMDLLYSGYKKFAKEVSPNKMIEYASKGGPLGYALLSFITGDDLQSAAAKGLTAHFGKKALGKISGKLLTDPKWVDLKSRAVKMIKDGSTDQLPKLINAIQKQAQKDIPDLEDESESIF